MRHLGMFAKYWQPGRVKTRLAGRVGAEPASKVYAECLAAQVRRLRHIADLRTIVYAPADRRREFQRLAGQSWQIEAQSEGDLGQRMQNFFTCAFASRADQVVLVGSDSPTLPLDIVGNAFTCLDQQPVVLGPAVDGGYYLIGLRENIPELFDSISWSSSQVWEQTIERLKKLRTPFAQLQPWYDVDELADLRRLERELLRLVKEDSSWRALADLVRRCMPEENQDGRERA